MVEFKIGHYYKRTYSDTSHIIFRVKRVDRGDYVLIKVLKNTDGDSLATLVHKVYEEATTIELDKLTALAMVL